MTRSLNFALSALLWLFGLISTGWSQPPAGGGEPAWPATFNLYAPQPGMYGFAVTQPGPITVVVQTQATAVRLQLTGPIAQPLQQQGSGVVQLRYTVTPEDVQRGVLWQLAIQPLGAPATQVPGTVSIQHPPANSAALQTAIAAYRARPPAVLSPQQQAQRTAGELAQRDTAFRQRVQAAQNELTQRRAAITHTLQPQIDALRQSVPATGSGFTSRGLPVSRLTPPAAPHINTLSAGEGVPGDPIMISGSGLGGSGQVHFVIGPDLQHQDLVPGALWGNGQIATSVPDPSVPDPSVGALPYNGFVYVLVGGVKSNFVPFKFDPIIDHRLIRVMASLSPTDASDYINNSREIRHTRGFDLFSSATGVDVLDSNVTLQNGWVVDGLPNYFGLSAPSNPASVGPLLATIGSPSLRAQVFWSIGPSVYVDRQAFYYIEIPIRGPRALPDGVVCVAQPPSNQKCPDIIQ
jgi:hypothetical protein